MSKGNLNVEYRIVKDFPAYRVGTDGTVWTRWERSGGRPGLRSGSFCVIGKKWRVLSPYINPDGYAVVSLCRNRQSYIHYVHRIVLESFVGPCPTGMQACHFPDRMRSNNSIANLRWGTWYDNYNDSVVHGTSPKGSRNGMSKISDDNVRVLRKRNAAGESTRSLAKEFGVSQSTVSHAICGRLWKHVS